MWHLTWPTARYNIGDFYWWEWLLYDTCHLDPFFFQCNSLLQIGMTPNVSSYRCYMRNHSSHVFYGTEGTMPSNMRYNVLMPGSRYYQSHLPKALGSFMCAEDETCSRRATPRFLPSPGKNCHFKHTCWVGQNSCRGPFPPCETNQLVRWSSICASTLVLFYLPSSAGCPLEMLFYSQINYALQLFVRHTQRLLQCLMPYCLIMIHWVWHHD